MTDVEIHFDRDGRGILVGVAHFTRLRGAVTTTFTYDADYIADRRNRAIDPALPLFSGNQYTPSLPGAFSDSAPDRWGRNLLSRRERQIAREKGRTPKSLDAVDFLLGVNDTTRQGALRYRYPGSDEFLSAETVVPRLVELPALLRASDEVAADTDGAAAYKILLAAGTASLGGARPKASVRLDNGALGIAKFPHSADMWDVMAWEALSLEIAERAGINVPTRKLVRVGDRRVLLIDRFDRVGDHRIGYMSAMTMLEETDGAAGDYAEIASRLADHSASLEADSGELFDRAVLNVALHNTDDHLRNHGFLATRRGWRLSPVFDVNPNPELAEARSTAISGATDVHDEWDGLLELARSSRISREEARHRVTRVLDAARTWPDVARGYGIPDGEQRLLAGALDDRIGTLDAAVAEMGGAESGRRRSAPSGAVRGKTTPGSNAGSFRPKAGSAPGSGLQPSAGPDHRPSSGPA